MQAAEGEAVAVASVRAACREHGMDIEGATACCCPFLLEPAAALHSAGGVSARVRRRCFCLVAGFMAGVSRGVRRGAACGLSVIAMAGLSLPAKRGLRLVLMPVRSAGQDVVCASWQGTTA